MTFDPAYAAEVMPILAKASFVNLQAATAGFALALMGGLILVLARQSRLRFVSLAAVAAVELIRDTPFLIQLYVLFFVLPVYGIRFDPLPTGILALGLNYSAYVAEVYRAGIEAVPRGQWEAAVALNLSTPHTWRHIVLPQAVPPVIPVLGNYLIAMFKESAILSVIAVDELLGTAKLLATETFRSLEPFTVVAALFLAMSVAGSAAVRIVESRLRVQ